MIEQTTQTYIIIYFIKAFVMNFYMYYSFVKITNGNHRNWEYIKFLLVNIPITLVYTYLEYNVNSILSLLTRYILFGISVATITKNKTGYSLGMTILSYAVCVVSFLFSVIINFVMYKLIYKENAYLNLAGILLFQGTFVYLFFRIKRFKNGFNFINNKFNTDMIDIIVVSVSLAVLLMGCLVGSLFDTKYEIVENLFITFIILGITMFIVIQRTLTMHYKQTQLLKTMDEYKNEIAEKDKEIEKLRNEKYNTSKIRHEFYHRQKALELLVKQNISLDKGGALENTSENILKIIENLSSEYSAECERIKQLDNLDKTGIPEIDSMFKYMQNECSKNDIEFKLKVIGNIYPLINNVIPKSKLETLIGDHIKDSINAVNHDNIIKKEIFVILGMKDGCYELVVYDTGKEFEIETLLKLGREATTTYANNGGSGIGFMTTFETLNEAKGSLIITETAVSNENYYTKSVTIRFDDKKQYMVRSYRAEEIKAKDKENRIIAIGLK